MKSWKLTGIIATFVIVAAIPAYMVKESHLRKRAGERGQTDEAVFVGSQKCMDCHKKQYDNWKDSHHDHAMDVVTDTTVLGNFDNALFEHRGVTSRFYKKNGQFFVHTQGPEGKMDDFEVKYTFGWYPLQQYLIPFPGGRLQCLPIAWDVRQKRWYHLTPNDPPPPSDWLYWTNAGQNWNGMCAECHSTNLRKNYDIRKDAYATTWSDIDVGCEACHGPGSLHVEWSEMPEMARPPEENYRLLVKTSGLRSRELVELCAPCHSRRAILGDYTHAEPDLLDSMLPQLLNEGVYFADGQILEEVYVYGSFTQSKMYHRDVRCSDCHDVHSIKLVKEGNELCLQCHRRSEYDTKSHHFHKKKGEKGDPIRSRDGKVLFEVGSGAECAQCHMPGRYYMGIDYRPDHSFRVPRPDLSVAIRAPNACNRCHMDKTAGWSEESITKWYGPGRRPHYGNVIEAGRRGVPGAKEDLVHLAADPLYPVVVRATALALLGGFPGKEARQAFELALMDDEALIRRTALERLGNAAEGVNTRLIAPLLYDPVKAVRIEAASALAGEPSKRLSRDQQRVFESVLKEYVEAMEYSGDFAFGRYNLGNLYSALNRPEDAIEKYKDAIAIDGLFYPAKVNLAMLYNRLGENDKAEPLLREVLAAEPDMDDISYSLGLLLAEKKKYREAVIYLERAAIGMPERSRVHYNLGLLLQYLNRDGEAERELMTALKLEPDNLDYLYALADYYLKRGDLHRAKEFAEKILVIHPDNPLALQMQRFIEDKLIEGRKGS